MKKHVVMTIIILVLLGILSGTAAASGTDPSGTALRAYVEQYIKTAPPTDALSARIKAAGGADAQGVNEWLCSLEISATLSASYQIWDSRMRTDSYYLEHFNKSQFIPLNITNYCITYSNQCDHWRWDKDCLSEKLGSWSE